MNKLPRKQHYSPPMQPLNKTTKYGNQHQPHTYNTRSRANVGLTYTGVPTPKQQMAFHVCTLTDSTNIEIKYNCNKYEPVINAVYCETTGRKLSYQQLVKQPDLKTKWETSFANEFGRLMNGVGTRMKSGTKTMEPIKFKHIPADRKAVYCKNEKIGDTPLTTCHWRRPSGIPR